MFGNMKINSQAVKQQVNNQRVPNLQPSKKKPVKQSLKNKFLNMMK